MESKAVSGIMLTLLLVSILTLTFNIQPVKAEKKPIPQGFSPFGLAITDDGEYAYLSFDLSEDIFKVRLEDLTVEAVADLSEYFPIECEDIALDISEEKLFVYTSPWRKLIVLDTQTMSVIHTIDNIDIVFRGITRSQYGPFLITWDGGHTVKFVNTETYKVTEFTDDKMFFLMIQESKYDQGQWYVASGQGPWPSGVSVGIYDYEDKLWNWSVPLPLQDEREVIFDLEVLPNEWKVYIATFGGWYPEYHAYGWLYSIDLVAEEIKVIPIDGGAMCLEASIDSKWLYVGTGWPVPNDKNLLVVDTRSDDIVGSIYLGQNKYGWPYTQMNKLQIDSANPNLLYATSTDGNAFIRVNLDSLTLADVLVLNEESYGPHFFVKRPAQATGYILICKSAEAFELDIDNATIKGMVEFPMIRADAYSYDVAISDTGRLFIAQGETVLEVDAKDMRLLRTHPLPPDVPPLWHFVLSNDQKRIYSISQERGTEGYRPNVFLAINTANFQVEARFRLEGGAFDERPYELPDGSRLYALGGEDFGPIVIQVIKTDNYTVQKTIIFDEPGSRGISGGPYYPFAYDSSSRTLFVGAGHVVLAIDTDTDVIKKVIYLRDVARAIGLEPWQLTYVNAVGLVYHPQENYLYIAHLDRSFISIYDLNNDRFLPQVIPLKGYFPRFLFANDGHSKIYCLMGRSDSVSVIDVKSKVEEKVIDLHDYSWDKIPPLADAGVDQAVDEDTIVTFDGSGSSDNVGIASYTWTFMEVSLQTLSGINPSYTFTNPGTYIVTLNVTDKARSYATDTVTITVLDVTPPVAEAGENQTVDEDIVVTLDGSNSTDNVEITSYSWAFIDVTPQTLSGAIVTYNLTNPGTYPITLNVTDAAGNFDTDTVTITITDVTPPVADAGSDRTVKVNTQVSLDASGSSDNVRGVSYEWDLGDGTTGTGKTATHTYKEPGTYNVTLTVRDAAGNFDTDTVTITVEGKAEFPAWLLIGMGAAIIIGIAVYLIVARQPS